MSEMNEHAHLKRKLGARHLNMIAIGGSIGTGLFLASGSTISTAGPGGALLAYVLIGIMIYFLMTSLGELATHNPTSGAFFTYGNKYVEEGFGFALGWNYWYNWAITVAFELVAAQWIMAFWFPEIPGFWWSLLFLIVIFAINAMSVRAFGESEFVFSLVKVIAIIIFILIGFATILKIMLTPNALPFANWTHKDAPFVGGFQAMVGIAISHYRFRKGYVAQGYKIEDLAYRAKFFPFAPWFAFILCSIIILGQNYQALLGAKIDWLSLLATYITLPLFLAVWLSYKWIYKTKLIPYNEMDVKPMRDDES